MDAFEIGDTQNRLKSHIPQPNIVIPLLSENADERTDEGNRPNNRLWLSWIMFEVCQRQKKDIRSRRTGHRQNDDSWHFPKRRGVG